MFVVSSASTGGRQSLPLFYRVSYARQSGERGSPNVTKNPTGLAEDVIVLPCHSVRLQGAD
jgi:hypothetical protein